MTSRTFDGGSGKVLGAFDAWDVRLDDVQSSVFLLRLDKGVDIDGRVWVTSRPLVSIPRVHRDLFTRSVWSAKDVEG